MIVFYKLLFGDYESDNGAGLTRVYSDISNNSVYSRMENLMSYLSDLEHKPEIMLTCPDENSKGNTHLRSAESMVIKKVKAESPEVPIITTRDVPQVVAYVNKILEKKIKSVSR